MRRQVAELPKLTAELQGKLDLIPAPWVEKVAAARGEVLAKAESFDTAVAGIERDPLLSSEGKRHAIAELAKVFRADLTKWQREFLDPLRERIDTGEQKQSRAANAPTPADPVTAVQVELRRSELRAALAALDPLERDVLYAEADPETALAMETAMPVLFKPHAAQPAKLVPFVSPKLVEMRRRLRAQEANPEAFRELEGLRAVERMYDGTLLRLVRGALNREVPEDRGPLEEPAARG